MTTAPMVQRVLPDPEPLRPLSRDELSAYARDGAAIVRGVIPAGWIAFMRDALERYMARSAGGIRSSADGIEYGAPGQPRFFSAIFMSLSEEDFRAFACGSPLPAIAAQALGAQRLNLFYDQTFVKEGHAGKAVPWHQDGPFLPIAGAQIIRVWVPLDPVVKEGGAVHYLKGSHLWPTLFRPVPFSSAANVVKTYVDSPYPPMPDIEASHDRHDWLVGECEPGDCILHHPRVIHGSPGNRLPRIRRALSAIYAGDDVTWDPHPGQFLDNPDLAAHVPKPDLAPGDPIECGLFPRVWPRER
jgi:ectoine hydroxylase-related dioxygenase (phytanoyl-CoA dioxygenase family)